MSGLAQASQDDASYSGLQRTLKAFAASLDGAVDGLALINAAMKVNGEIARATAGQLGEADGDGSYVELTDGVAALLLEAAAQAQRTKIAAHDGAVAAREAASLHREKYGALDEIRSSRTTKKTPKPGFFDD